MTYCCERCPIWGTCETKWYRGERNEEQFCCNNCPDYYECNPELKKNRPVGLSKKKRN